MQRCLDNVDGEGGNNDVQVEVDSLMENLLVARWELLGHEMKSENDDNKKEEEDDGGDDSGSSNDDGVDYAELIQKENGAKDDESSSNGSEEEEEEEDDGNNLSSQLQNEYESLRTSWKTILNKHHSNLALHSGMSVNSSKFQSKAVDLSFWDQVKFATSQGGGNTVDAANKTKKKEFDDSKLYQQMLKDFISQSSSAGGGGGSATKRADPAQEAAERLKRAMRKKNGGGEGDVDLTSLLLAQDGGASNLPNGSSNGAAASNKANVDRRASKGRKIRYTVHPKLVNFTFPVARPEPMIKEDIWFKSLFGGVGKV